MDWNLYSTVKPTVVDVRFNAILILEIFDETSFDKFHDRIIV